MTATQEQTLDKTSRSEPAARRCRVLHVIDSFDMGGAQEVLVNLVKYGDRSQFEFEVATMHGHGVYWDKLRALDVPVYSLSRHSQVPTYIPKMAWLCLRRGYDVVHTHLTGANVIAKPIAALCGVPIRINHDHCNDKLAAPQSWIAKIDRVTNRLSTHIIAVSESTREFLLSHEGIALERATTIYNGIDIDRYRFRPELRLDVRKEFGCPGDAFLIAGIGRLTYQKNFTLFLDVAKKVLARMPKAYFIIAGTGGEAAALRQKAKDLKIEDRVRFLGYVADMRRLYPAIDMLLLTSRYEGLPITILEAMATGAVIVASRLDGIEEILVDGMDGALVSKDDIEAFASRVCELIESDELRQRYRETALTKVRAGYSAAAMTRAVEAIYLKYWPRPLVHSLTQSSSSGE